MLELAAALLVLADDCADCAPEAGPIYADVGPTHVTFQTEDDFGFETTSRSAISHVGWDATRYFGPEAEIGLVSFPVENNNEYLTAKVKTTVTLGAYGVARYPFTEKLTGYARVGYVYADAEFTVEAQGVEVKSEDTFRGVGYGGGIRWRLGESRYGVRAEYTRYDLDEIEADSVTIALQRHF